LTAQFTAAGWPSTVVGKSLHRKSTRIMADTTISTRDNGPLLVSGPVCLTDHAGNAYDLGGKDVIALCRCGATANRPFCDGSHKSCGFEARETAPSA